MVNNQTGKPYTKEDIIEKANIYNGQGLYGDFINTDGIRYDLDGKGMAEYLQSIGFEIISYKDKGTNGEVKTKEGIKASTNGFISKV